MPSGHLYLVLLVVSFSLAAHSIVTVTLKLARRRILSGSRFQSVHDFHRYTD